MEHRKVWAFNHHEDLAETLPSTCFLPIRWIP